MPDLLLLSADTKWCFELEEVAKADGMRVKSTPLHDVALQWLKFKEFDVVVADNRFPVMEQQQLADLLWRQNPLALFIAVDCENGHVPGAESEARLFGAELLSEPNLRQKLSLALKKVKPRSEQRTEDFKILVVEDLDAPRDIICSFVEGLGFPAVHGKPSAREALSILENNPREFNCIVTDIRMPDISGDKFIEQVRSHDLLRHIPIIVLTAHGTVDCLVDCLKAGASGFLVKPPRKKDLIRELSRALRISTYGASPRLASHDEAEAMRMLLSEKGFT